MEVFQLIKDCRYEELKVLVQTKTITHLLQNGQSALIYAASVNNFRSCETMLKAVEDSHWVNQHAESENHFTALHFASFFGNLALIKLLVKCGANVFAVNRLGINMIHVAAQGDQALSIAYFQDLGININSIDLTNSQAIHWAAFTGAELAIGYIIAWGAKINQPDRNGMTPLHLAVKNFNQHKSLKVIKSLLIHGADRTSKDNKGLQPVQYTASEEIEQLLAVKWSLFSDFLMVRPAFKKQTKSVWTMLLYYTLMVASFTCLWDSCYFTLRLTGNHAALLITNYVTFGITILLLVVVSLSDPGRLKKGDNFQMLEMLQRYEYSSICPFCEVLRTPRSRHCNLCNQCFDRFDHHCPWVNNCVGRKNFIYFYLLVLFQTAYLLAVVYTCILYFKIEFQFSYVVTYARLRRLTGVIFSCVSLLFLCSILVLCWAQTGNLFFGQTTCERFGRINHQELTKQQQQLIKKNKAQKTKWSIMSIQEQPGRFAMCCDTDVMSQQDIDATTKSNYQSI